MTQYRTKQVKHDVFHLTPESRWDNSEWPNWLNKAWNTDGEGGLWPDPDAKQNPEQQSADDLCIGTKEGVMRCPIGYWIILGKSGEIWCCDPEYFDSAYEEVAD